MAVSLVKGANVSLTKTSTTHLAKVRIGLGWDARQTSGADYDLDASAIMLGADDKVHNDKGFVYWGNLTSPEGAVHHLGDNLTGVGDGDDEVIEIELALVPDDCVTIVFPVTIYKGTERGQSFGQVSKAYIRVLNADTGEELARFDLSEDAGTETCMVFGTLYRNPSDATDWKFKAIEQGYNDGLAGLAKHYGVHVA